MWLDGTPVAPVVSGSACWAALGFSRRPAQSGFVSTNCVSFAQNYTIKGASGGGTYQVQMSLQASIVFPRQ